MSILRKQIEDEQSQNLQLQRELLFEGSRTMLLLAHRGEIADSLREFHGQQYEWAVCALPMTTLTVDDITARTVLGSTLLQASWTPGKQGIPVGVCVPGIELIVSSNAPEKTRLAAKRLESSLAGALPSFKIANVPEIRQVRLTFTSAQQADLVGPSDPKVIRILFTWHP